jgi:hypothetical protein
MRRALGDAIPLLRSISRRLRMLQAAFYGSRLWNSLKDAEHSPLRLMALRFQKSLQNDYLLPNPYSPLVILRRLKNNDVMCFWHEEIDTAPPVDKVDRGVDYWTWMADELKQDHFSILVVLVPNKFSVYQPFLQDQSAAVEDPGRFMTILEERLRAKGIPVVNLLPSFRSAAARGLERRSYIYWPADTHWNPVGAALAAEEICKVWAASPGLNH